MVSVSRLKHIAFALLPVLALHSIALALATGCGGPAETSEESHDALEASTDVIVAGGGIAGLVAAYELQKKGRTVTVFEKEAVAGGRLSIDSVAGVPFDRGAQIVTTQARTMPALIKELGMSKDLVAVSPWVAMARDGILYRARFDAPTSLLTSGYLKLADVPNLAVVTDLPKLLSSGFRPIDDYTGWASLDDELSSTWGDRVLGKSATSSIVDPMLSPLFGSPENTSKVIVLWHYAYVANAQTVYTMPGGYGTVARELAKRLDVRTKTTVTRVFEADGRVRVVVQGPFGTRQYSARQVIIATPAGVTKTVLDPKSCGYPTTLVDTPYASTLNVSVVTRRRFDDIPALKDAYAMMFSEVESKEVHAVALGSSMPGRVGPGRELLQIYARDAYAKAHMRDSDETIRATMLGLMEKYIPGLTASVEDVKVTRLPLAIPISAPGKAKAIQAYRDRITATRCPVVAAGDYLGLPGTDGAAGTALWAVGALTRP